MRNYIARTPEEKEIAESFKGKLERLETFDGKKDSLEVRIWPTETHLTYWTAKKKSVQGQTRCEIRISNDSANIFWIERAIEFRGRQIGRKLYLLIEELLREQGCTEVKTTPSDKSTKEYCESLGFEQSYDGTGSLRKSLVR